MDFETKKRFLKLISLIESSGGKNVDHKQMKTGLHKGDSAMGQYGLMPNTLKEITNRRRLQHRLGPDDGIMSQVDPKNWKQVIETQPLIEQNYAADLAERVIKKAGGDLEKAAYMWNQGHNLDPSKITEEQLAGSGYVKKFKDFNKVEKLLFPKDKKKYFAGE
jgi:hypothetical protein